VAGTGCPAGAAADVEATPFLSFPDWAEHAVSSTVNVLATTSFVCRIIMSMLLYARAAMDMPQWAPALQRSLRNPLLDPCRAKFTLAECVILTEYWYTDA